jgi:microcystin-dependent protein
MGEPFLSEIRIVSFNFAPKGWAMCNGQLLPINQNQALFSLLGTTYGGNGQTTFALPNCQGRVPMHVGQGHLLGEKAGEAIHTLSTSEMPAHAHTVNATNNNGTTRFLGGNYLGAFNNGYSANASSNLTTLEPSTIASAGGSQAHENRQPFLTLTFCIALVGIFPSQN